MMVGLELTVDELYSINQLEDSGYDMMRFHSSWSLFTDSELQIGYLFRHVPFKKLKIRFKYEKSFRLPESAIWTEFDDEQYKEDLDNCCGPLRLGIDYTPPE